VLFLYLDLIYEDFPHYHAQVEGIKFEETFSLVAKMETIRLILDYACSKNIKVYQMDVKSTFLNGELEE
jgi:hypothetical protein